MRRILTGEKGLTLIELLVVVSIIGIIAAGAVTKIGKDQDAAELAKSSRVLMSDLRQIRTRAIAENRQYKFKISGANSSYETSYLSGGSFQLFETVTLKRGMTISGSSSEFTFQTDGNCSGSYTLTLTDRDGVTKNISITDTGMIELQ